jgi:translocation and assembly module TamB
MAEPTREASGPAPHTVAGAAGPARVPVWALRVLLAALLLTLLALASLWALLRTTNGTQWLLKQSPRLVVQGVEGGLLSPEFAADQVQWKGSNGELLLQIDGLRWEGAGWSLERRSDEAVRPVWSLRSLSIQRLQQLPGAPSAESSPRLEEPETLELPLGIRVASWQLKQLLMPAQPALEDLRGSLALGTGPTGSEHQLNLQHLAWRGVRLSGDLSIGAAAPLPVSADLRLAPAADAVPDSPAAWMQPLPWRGSVRATGPMALLDTQADLWLQSPQAEAGPPGVSQPSKPADPSAPASAEPADSPRLLAIAATIRPFEAWPLRSLQAALQDLDLSAIVQGAPRTRLSGQASLAAFAPGSTPPAAGAGADSTSRAPAQTGDDPPVLQAEITLTNQEPGPYAEGALPLRQLGLKLDSTPDNRHRVSIQNLSIALAGAQQAAGRLEGQGVWEGDRLSLDVQLQDIQPAQLDASWPAMRLGGPLALTLLGLPSPDGQAPEGREGQANAAQAQLQTNLTGTATGAPAPVALDLTAQWRPEALHVEHLMARVGNSRATASAQIEREASKAWRVRSQGAWERFEPQQWWPGLMGDGRDASGQRLTSRTKRRPDTRLDGRWAADLRLPASAAGQNPSRIWQAIRGTAQLSLANSRWAGLPLQAELALDHPLDGAASKPISPAGAQPGVARLKGHIALGETALNIDGRAATQGDGRDDRLSLALNAPELAQLQPLLERWSATRATGPLAGALQVQADLQGRWPALGGSLSAQADKLRAGEHALESLRATASLSPEDTGPLQAEVQASGLRWNRQDGGLQTLDAQLSGTRQDQALKLSVRAPLQAPLTLARTLDWPEPAAAAPALLQLEARGGWPSAPAGSRSAASSPSAAGTTGRQQPDARLLPLRSWQGQITRLTVGPTAAPAAWLAAEPVDIQLEWTANHRPVAATLAPGRLRSGVLQLQWTKARWQTTMGTPQPEFQIELQTDPLAVAPLLTRLKRAADKGSAAQAPGQWQGDLQVGATARLQSGPTGLQADVRLARLSGDLRYRDNGGSTQDLGLEAGELRLTASAGLWRLMPDIQGRRLGALNGEWQARTSATAWWPSPDAALAGEMRLQVPALAAWSAWLPPGWSTDGTLAADARLSGTPAQPRLTGQVSAGQWSVRNPLQGVDLHDGQLRVVLEGETARIENLRIRGGEGTLQASGQAKLGEQPQLTLQANAQSLRVLGRIDRQLVISGDAALQLGPQQLVLNGRLRADKGFFDLARRDAPSLDEDVAVLRNGQEPPEAAGPREPSPWMRQARVDVQLDLGDQLRLKGRGIDTALAGSLRLRAPQGRPELQGSVQTVGGSYAAYGQKLSIERGRVLFEGPADRARLDVLALRENTDLRVGVAITGSVLDPRIRLYSEPEMTETEKLSWLVLGRSSGGLGAADTAILQRAALALLAGEGESASDAALRRLGLDEFSIRQGDGDTREAVISVGKQISRRWYLGYERGVNATAGTWQLVYRAAQRFTLRAQSGQESALDLIWSWQFGKPPPGP